MVCFDICIGRKMIADKVFWDLCRWWMMDTLRSMQVDNKIYNILKSMQANEW